MAGDSTIVRVSVRNVSPAYFATVMDTGIISIAAHLLGYETTAIALFWLNLIGAVRSAPPRAPREGTAAPS